MGRENRTAIADLLASLDTPRAAAERAAVLVARARLAGVDGDWHASDSLFGRGAATKFEDATFERGRFLSLASLDPPPAMIARRDGRPPRASDHHGARRAWAESFAAMLALRLGDAAPAAIALPRSAVECGQADYYVRELAVELSARRLLAIGKPDEALAVLLTLGAS